MLRILCIGYHGFSNAGDDWLLSQTQFLFKKQNPSIQIECLTTNRYKIPWLFSYDAFVYAGGSLLQDSTSYKSFYFYLVFLFFAILLRKPVLFLGQGLGPISHPFHRFLCRFFIQHANVQGTLRDEESLGYLKGVSHHLIVANDLAFYPSGITLNPSVSLDGFMQGSVTNKTCMGLNLRPWSFDSNLVLQVIKKANLHWKGISLSCEDAFLYQTFQFPDVVLDLKPGLTLIQGKKLEMKGMLVMRYHAAVWAAIQGIPFFMLVYDPKCEALARCLGQPLLSVSFLDSFQEKFTDFLAQLSSYQEILQRKLKDEAAKSFLHETAVAAFLKQYKLF